MVCIAVHLVRRSLYEALVSYIPRLLFNDLADISFDDTNVITMTRLAMTGVGFWH